MPFCKLHMPKQDTTIILEDESGEEYKASYIAQRTALSAGWKAFSADHKLVEGDVLVFHLVGSSKFKVHDLIYFSCTCMSYNVFLNPLAYVLIGLHSPSIQI